MSSIVEFIISQMKNRNVNNQIFIDFASDFLLEILNKNTPLMLTNFKSEILSFYLDLPVDIIHL